MSMLSAPMSTNSTSQFAQDKINASGANDAKTPAPGFGQNFAFGFSKTSGNGSSSASSAAAVPSSGGTSTNSGTSNSTTKGIGKISAAGLSPSAAVATGVFAAAVPESGGGSGGSDAGDGPSYRRNNGCADGRRRCGRDSRKHL